MPTVVNPERRRDDSWNTHHRSEAPMQRADRNFAELLQELRAVSYTHLTLPTTPYV